MKNIVFVLAVISAFLVMPLVFAEEVGGTGDVKAQIDLMRSYARDYESGKLSYLQLRIHSTAIRSKIRELVGEQAVEVKMGDEKREGVTKEAAEKMFGKPTEMTDWVQMMDKDRPAKIGYSVPRWEKTIFEGSKVKVKFNAWPHAITMEDGSTFVYYWVDFEVRFKKQFDFNFESIVQTNKDNVKAFAAGRMDAASAAKQMVKDERIIRSYVEENKDKCGQIMNAFFGTENKEGQQKKIRYEGPLYSGKDFELMFHTDACDGCDWPWVYTEVRLEGRGPGLKIDESQFEAERKQAGMRPQEEYDRYSAEELQKMIEERIADAFSSAGSADKSSGNARQQAMLELAKKAIVYKEEIRTINDVLNRKYNDQMSEEERKENFAYRLAGIEDMITKHSSSIRIRPIGEESWSITLDRNAEEKTNRNCRHINDVQCGPDEGCFDGKCVPARGGGEACENGADDDRDGRVDCEDPDCFESEACLCKRSECWRQPNMQCKVVSGPSINGVDITAISAAQDDSYVYAMMEVDGGLNLGQASYGMNIWDEAAKTGHDFRMEGENFIMDSGRGPEKASEKGVEMRLGQAFEIRIPKTLFSGQRIFVSGRTSTKDPWVDNDFFDGVMAKQKKGDIAADGSASDAGSYGESKEDAEGDVLTRSGQCSCAEGWHDCDGNWQNGCESQEKCFKPEMMRSEMACGPEGECGKAQYMCNGIMQDAPCTPEPGEQKYVCNGKESPVPCETLECGGKNFHKNEEGRCVCDEGWQDCDNVGDCESKSDVPCGTVRIETDCSNGIDDDSDGFTDCEDVRECGMGMLCGMDPEGSALFCFDGKCERKEAIETAAREECSDGADNDRDGMADCEDPDCPDDTACGVTKTGDFTICFDRRCVPIGEAYKVLWSVPKESWQQPEQQPQPAQTLPPETTQPEPQPAQPKIEQVISPTGMFLSAVYAFERKACASAADCNPGQDCEKGWGCHCVQGKYDCNGEGDGEDADGCESADMTCGGTREICGGGCKQGQYCNMKTGNCECANGFIECNGDWNDGCEMPVLPGDKKDQGCPQCNTDADCAPNRCENSNMVHQFGCFQGESWTETRGEARIRGNCESDPTGMVWGGVNFDVGGQPYEEIGRMKSGAEAQLGGDWCEWELENLVKERAELQASMNDELLKWFFEDYVMQEPAKWEEHIGGIWDIYWSFVENSRRTSEMLSCGGKEAVLPESFRSVRAKYDSEYGSVEFWEEKKTTDMFGKKVEIMSPYMKIWVFPPKQFIKDEMIKAMKEGRMPGPEGEKAKQGPSPEEVREAKSHPEVMSVVNGISNRFGGDLQVLFTVRDEGQEDVFKILFEVNPDIIASVNPVYEYEGTPDVTLTTNFDFMYNMISRAEKDIRGARTEVPPWEGKSIGDQFNDALMGAKMSMGMVWGVINGDIDLQPKSAIPSLMMSLGDVFDLKNRMTEAEARGMQQ